MVEWKGLLYYFFYIIGGKKRANEIFGYDEELKRGEEK